jgi:hypothetical protein
MTNGNLYRALSELSARTQCHLDNNSKIIMNTDTLDAVRTRLPRLVNSGDGNRRGGTERTGSALGNGDRLAFSSRE